MKASPLALTLVSLAMASGAAMAQSAPASSTGGSDVSSTGIGTDAGVGADPASGSDRSSTGAADDAATRNLAPGTSSSGTSSYGSDASSASGTSSSNPRQWRHTGSLQRANAAGGLPAGDLSTPWQDAGGEAGSLMQ